MLRRTMAARQRLRILELFCCKNEVIGTGHFCRLLGTQFCPATVTQLRHAQENVVQNRQNLLLSAAACLICASVNVKG